MELDPRGNLSEGFLLSELKISLWTEAARERVTRSGRQLSGREREIIGSAENDKMRGQTYI